MSELYDRVRANLAALQTPVWPADRLRRLVDAHETGVSFQAVARQVGRGTTKNACISQAHRIGLPQRDRGEQVAACLKNTAPEREAKAQARREAAFQRERDRVAARTAAAAAREEKAARQAARPSASSEAVRAALALPGLAPVLISALARTQCKFPVGDPKSPHFAFCGRLKVDDRDVPYCTAHHAVAYRPAPPRAQPGPAVLKPHNRRSGAWA